MKLKKTLMENLSDEEFEKIVLDSFSITEVTKKCGYKTYKSGGGRDLVIKRIKLLNLDTSHFMSNGRQFEKTPHNKITDYTKIFTKKSMAHRTTIREIVLREKLLDYKCAKCGNLGEWNNLPLSLQLHHIDGDISNNEIENLAFLCPNCHSQTENYGCKNVKKKNKKIYRCTQCGAEITKDTRTGKCKECALRTKKIMIPSKEDLIKIVKEIKFKKYICYHYGICEHTLENWLASYELPTHISELHKYLEEKSF